MCPHCHQEAPVIYRGVIAYCTACGAPRPPLAGSALKLAGQPSKVGGIVASATGFVVLLFGLVAALLVGLFFQWVFPAGIVGWVLGVLLSVVSLAIGVPLLLGGRHLKRQGQGAEKGALLDAAAALARHKGGSVTAREAAKSLAIGYEQADALLTEAAKADPDRVGVEVNDAGVVEYWFRDTQGGRTRVADVDFPPRDAALDAERAAAEAEAEEVAAAGSAAPLQPRRR
jgi:hypothetical protein